MAAALVLAGVSLAACGDEAADSGKAEDNSSTSESPTTPATDAPPTEPACADVWTAGAELPQDYRGCQDAENDKWVEAFVYRCSSGQKLVTFRRNFYAAKGGVVTETATPLARNQKFQKALAACTA